MGQRSQIYVRYNGRLIIANYYQWNYAERMISRARWGIEYLKDFVDKGYDFAFRDPSYITRFSRIFDTNFDMHDVAISCDIVKEYHELFPDRDFNDSVFNKQDNNDGQLFVDIQDGKIFYCFRDMYENKRMNATQYMKWDCSKHWDRQKDHNPAFDDCYLDAEEIETCKANIKAIGEMAELMTKTQLNDFLNGSYAE